MLPGSALPTPCLAHSRCPPPSGGGLNDSTHLPIKQTNSLLMRKFFARATVIRSKTETLTKVRLYWRTEIRRKTCSKGRLLILPPFSRCFQSADCVSHMCAHRVPATHSSGSEGRVGIKFPLAPSVCCPPLLPWDSHSKRLLMRTVPPAASTRKENQPRQISGDPLLPVPTRMSLARKPCSNQP